MIISFNPTIFETKDSNILESLGEILRIIPKNRHFIDPRSMRAIFFDNKNQYIFDKSVIAQEYLSPNDKRKIKDYIENYNRPLTQLHKHYLTPLKIGIGSGEIHPKDAYRIISERSLIIIENYPNDWNFIESIINNYKDFGERKSIYKLIKKTLDDQYLSYDHGGGTGIKAQLNGWINGIYHDIHKFKLFLIFDSDKTQKDDFKNLNVGKKNLMKDLKRRMISKPPTEQDISYNDNDLVVWHILYKRAMENYVPVEVIISNVNNVNNLDESKEAYLKSLTPEQMDFINYYNYITIGKDKFSEMFLTDVLSRELEDRCSHHKVSITLPNGTIEQVSEIEQILLKIAKII